jgi:hypothetical protein
MCCLLAIGGLIGPRVALLFAWIFTKEVDQAFGNFWLPLLGLIFAPWTTLLYSIAYAPVVGVSGFWGIALVAIGILLDLGSYFGGSRARGR